MTEQELKEKIIQLIAGSRDEVCNACGEPIEADNPEHTAMEIFYTFKQANYVQLNPDQSLPQVPSYHNLNSPTAYNRKVAYDLAQQDMLEQGWRKVEP